MIEAIEETTDNHQPTVQPTVKEEPINIKPQDRIFPIRCDLCTTNRNVYLQEVTR
jgi:hypothetical protein